MAAMPEGFHTITPHLTVSDAKAAIALYEAALGATNCGALTTLQTVSLSSMRCCRSAHLGCF